VPHVRGDNETIADPDHGIRSGGSPSGLPGHGLSVSSDNSDNYWVEELNISPSDAFKDLQ